MKDETEIANEILNEIGTGRGGYREGSGRKEVEPKFKKNPLPVKIAQWRIDFLNSKKELTGDSRAVLIEKALDSYYKLQLPK